MSDISLPPGFELQVNLPEGYELVDNSASNEVKPPPGYVLEKPPRSSPASSLGGAAGSAAAMTTAGPLVSVASTSVAQSAVSPRQAQVRPSRPAPAPSTTQPTQPDHNKETLDFFSQGLARFNSDPASAASAADHRSNAEVYPGRSAEVNTPGSWKAEGYEQSRSEERERAAQTEREIAARAQTGVDAIKAFQPPHQETELKSAQAAWEKIKPPAGAYENQWSQEQKAAYERLAQAQIEAAKLDDTRALHPYWFQYLFRNQRHPYTGPTHSVDGSPYLRSGETQFIHPEAYVDPHKDPILYGAMESLGNIATVENAALMAVPFGALGRAGKLTVSAYFALQMGRGLYEKNKEFRSHIDRINDLAQQLQYAEDPSLQMELTQEIKSEQEEAQRIFGGALVEGPMFGLTATHAARETVDGTRAAVRRVGDRHTRTASETTTPSDKRVAEAQKAPPTTGSQSRTPVLPARDTHGVPKTPADTHGLPQTPGVRNVPQSSGDVRSVPAMGKNMTQDSPAVRKVQAESEPVSGQVPEVKVKQEPPQVKSELARPPAPVRAEDAARIGQQDQQSGRKILQPSNDVIQNERLANQAAPDLTTRLSRIAASVAGAKLDRLRPQKGLERLQEKVASGKPPQTIGDNLAAQIVAKTVKAKNQLIERLRQEFPVISVDDQFTGLGRKAGYPSANIQVQMPNGATAEVQIVTPEVQAITDQTHALYTAGRRFPEGSADRAWYWNYAARMHRAALEKFSARNANPATAMLAPGEQVMLRNGEPGTIESVEPKLNRVVVRTGSGLRTVRPSDLASSATRPVRVASSGQGIRRASTIRAIEKGETISNLLNELMARTWETGNEHAIICLKNGERYIVSGGPGGISFKVFGKNLRRVIVHTHDKPGGISDFDFETLDRLGQKASYIYEMFGAGITKFYRKY